MIQDAGFLKGGVLLRREQEMRHVAHTSLWYGNHLKGGLGEIWLARWNDGQRYGTYLSPDTPSCPVEEGDVFRPSMPCSISSTSSVAMSEALRC